MDNPWETVPGSGEDRAQRSGLGHSLMPRAPRSSQTVRTSGQTRPVSIRPIVDTETPEASASCCWLSCGPERAARMAIATAATCSTARRSAGEMSRRHGPTGQRPFEAVRSRGMAVGTGSTLAASPPPHRPPTPPSVTDDRSVVRTDMQSASSARVGTDCPVERRTVKAVKPRHQQPAATDPTD